MCICESNQAPKFLYVVTGATSVSPTLIRLMDTFDNCFYVPFIRLGIIQHKLIFPHPCSDGQGPRSNFEIGGGMTEYWEGKIHIFLLTLYNFKNNGGHMPPPPLLRGP